MSKIVHFIIVIAAITVACNRKALPTITERRKDAPPPAKKIIDVKPDIEMGKTIFMNRCSRCHDLPKPEQYTSQRWEGILSYMIPRARLNDKQSVHVTAYLKANAAK
ncbi:MAG: hypothetical protein LH619_05605 [Chitinophagaceae bacterium]|nr:hypothetical protein [Chitinophagaceae bacterium]